MDPLSVTLAAITLATAVKDMVELGQKIHESFAKIPSNYQKAQSVAKDIKEMADEIKVFCEDHKDALDNMQDFRLALLDLLVKFRNFEASVLPLLPRTGEGRRARFIRGWDAWRNSSKIEGSILNLQSDIMKLIRKFMVKSAMRTEAKLETIHHETSRNLEVLGYIRRDVSTLCITAATMPRYSHEPSESGATARNIIMVAQSTSSTSSPMLRTPDTITEEVMATSYIKLQINNIAMTVERMSKLGPISVPCSVKQYNIPTIINHGSMSITRLRHQVVRQAITIHDFLDNASIHAISIKDGAIALDNLSAALETLGMKHESIQVGKWAIALARVLVNTSGGHGQPELRANLAHYLLNQSIRYDGAAHQWVRLQLPLQYVCNRDRYQSLKAIDEAYTLAQGLREQYSGEQFQILYSTILSQYAALSDHQRSMEMSIEAVQVLEKLLNTQAFTWSKSLEKFHIQEVVQPGSSFLDHLFTSSLPITAITTYAGVLQRLGTYLLMDGQPESALDLERLAVAVRRKIVSIHGQEYQAELAWTLSSMVLNWATSHIPAEELVDMADECIQLLRDLAVKNPLSYARELVSVLWEKADALVILRRDAEVVTSLEEAVSVAEQIIQDSEVCAHALDLLGFQLQRLNRHDDGVQILTQALAIATYQPDDPLTQPLRYMYLSEELLQLRRYKESAEAAQKFVATLRPLVMKDPETCACYLPIALANLAQCLAASGDHYGALRTWKEMLVIVDNFFDTNPDASEDDIEPYLMALSKHAFVGFALESEAECIEASFLAAKSLRQLSEIRPEDTAIVVAMFSTQYSYAYNMLRAGLLQDAQDYLNTWLDLWTHKAEITLESRISQWYAMAIYLRGDILDAQGCTEQALLTIQRMPETMRLSFSAYQPSVGDMIEAMVHEARLRVNLGDYEEALQVAEGALQLSRDNKPEPDAENLRWSLHTVALTASWCSNYKRAVEAAREGCNMYASPEDLKLWQYNLNGEEEIFIRPSLLAILSSAEANLGKCTTALEYAHRAVNASLEIKDMKGYITATTAERSYMETRGYLAKILLFTGDLAQTRQICEEQRAYFSKRVDKRVGEYRDLGPILRMLGVLCCSEGCHEEGEASAKELSRIMKTLGSAFPSLQEQVKIRLRQQAKVPILQILNDMSDKLECGHQTEVGSLFAI